MERLQQKWEPVLRPQTRPEKENHMVVESVERENDGPWDLPEGWAWVELRDIGSWTSGGTPKSTEPDYYDGPVPWFRITELNEGRLRKSEKSLTVRGLEESSAKIIQAPFLMFAMYGASIGKMAISEIDASTNQAIACCSPSDAVDIDFLFLALQRLKRKIIALGQGGAQPNISQRILLECTIPLAPLAEQRRIVARVDALFAEIASGEAALDAARKGLDTFRRALLKAAVTGELTKDWRQENEKKSNPVTETGHDLLARIRSERVAKGQAKGRGKRSPDAPPLDTAALPELPEGWAWERLSALGDFGRGKSRHRPRDDTRLYGGTMPFVQTGIVTNSDDFIRSHHQTYSDFGVEQSRVWPPGTLCITIAANIAKTAITTFDCCFPDSIVGLKPVRQIDPYWVHIWVKTIQQRLERFAPATAQKNINLEVLDAVAVPIPPPAEAAEILRRVTQALAASADTLAMLDAEAADAARLKQSILKAAFEGRLVPQDPADEPASAMLARLRATQSTARPAKRGRRRRS